MEVAEEVVSTNIGTDEDCYVLRLNNRRDIRKKFNIPAWGQCPCTDP